MRTIEEIRTQFLELKAPFVWSLKLSLAEFELVRSYVAAHHGKDDSPIVMICVAEWYKRCYDLNSSINQELEWLDAESVWRNCGFRGFNQWVYSSDRGKEWIYSMYVLGGLASRLECGHPDDKLLEQLCRLYHGEELTLSATGSRAIALAHSIENEGSLFYFIQEIVSGRLPYAQSDIDDKSGSVYGLLRLLRNANKRALRDKFNCEWIVNYADFYETMSRRLKLGLRPERGSHGQRQYLSYERIEGWGFDNPNEIARIKISLQFSCDGEIVKAADFDNPVLTYSNTGNDDIGFLAWGSKDAAISENIPNRFFSSVDVIVQAINVDGNKEEKAVAANADFPEFLQVYRIANRMTDWSSQYRNSATAVVYNKSCTVVAPPDAPVVEKPFFLATPSENEPRESEAYCWTDIEDSILIRDKFGVETRLYNRSGGYEIMIKRFDDEIAYGPDGTVKHLYRSDYDSDWLEEPIQILFGLHNLEVRKYKTDSEDYEAVSPENIFFRQNGNLITGVEHLQEGYAEIVITLQGKNRLIKVWYVPYSNEAAPVSRDFKEQVIRMFDGVIYHAESEELIHDITRGNDLERVIIPVYAPIEGHEVWIDDVLVERVPLGNRLQIPYLYCEHFCVKTIDRKGIRLTTGKELRECYYNAPDQGQGDKVLDGYETINGIEVYRFNPQTKPTHKTVAGGIQIPIYDKSIPRHYGLPIFPKSSPFAKIKGISAIDAFETAVAYNTYFFVFKELKQAVRKESLIDELIIPLIQKGTFDSEVKKELWRLAFEFHFDWMLLPRSSWEKVPMEMREDVNQLFLSSPKAVNEYERRQLDVFVENYWDFTDFSTTDNFGKKALRMILGQTGETAKERHDAMLGFINEYDHSPVKFHEMTKIINN